MEKIQNKTNSKHNFMLICQYFLLFSENFMPDNLLVFGLYPSRFPFYEQIIHSDVIFTFIFL